MKIVLLGLGIALAGCAADTPGVAGLEFAHHDGTIEQAWGAARTTGQVDSDFRLVASGMPAGTTVRLIAGRSTDDPAYPLTTGDDVIMADEHLLATSRVAADGSVTFPALTVTSGTWTSDTATVPDALLCGETVLAARAYRTSASAEQQLASTWLVVVAPACD